MDNKKQFASLLEDHTPGPSTASVRPVSPFQDYRLGSRTRGGGSTGTIPSPTDLDPDLPIHRPTLSCVTKETSNEDCARHRFIVWAAVKRNSSVRMTSQERLECPLLRCTQRFGDHESMLKHLAGCRYLASGEYWCYDHMRVERFDDLKCKRCLGHPSKRKKIVHMAKNFFHSLGHKSKKPHGAGFDDDEVIFPPPPSYDSLNIPAADPHATELPSTEILEIDSMEVPLFEPSPMPAPSDVIDPQALIMPPAPPLPELDSTMLSGAELMPWQPLSGDMHSSFPPLMPQEDGFVRAPVTKPTLQLETAGLQGRRQAPRPAPRPVPAAARGKGLSPSSSVRSTASTETNASMMSNGSSMVSPASNWSGAWSMGSGMNTGRTSPVDGVVADDMFANALNNYNDACPDSVHDFFSELPADLPDDMPMLDNACNMASDAFVGFDVPVPASLAFAPENILTENAARAVELGEPDVEQTNMCCSETKSLISSAWDALEEHLITSMAKIQSCMANHLASQLRSMSIGTVATIGLRTLRGLINGRQPSSASDALCLIHLVYAFSLVLHEQGASDRSKDLFLQSLEYIYGLPPNERAPCHQLIISIWQPPNVGQADIGNHLATRSGLRSGSYDPKGKAPAIAILAPGRPPDDSLLTAARDFLDVLEMSHISQSDLPCDVPTSDLYLSHLKDMNQAGPVLNGALLATTKHVLRLLSQKFGDAELNSKLRGVYQKLSTGMVCSVRRVEIEILQAGRNCLPPSRFFGEFVSETRVLCGQLYEQHDVGPSRRDVYHGLGATLIESLVPELDSSAGGKAEAAALDDLDAFFNDLNTEAGLPATAFTEPPQPSDSQMSRLASNQGQLPTPTATTSGTPSSSQTVSPAAEQVQQPAPTESQEQAGQKVEAHDCCELCGYRPKGDPQWFKGSMAKHKKLQHSTQPPKIYECPYPGCNSKYKNRADNLRQHQIEKNHWVQGDESTSRRPSKRKKVAEEE